MRLPLPIQKAVVILSSQKVGQRFVRVVENDDEGCGLLLLIVRWCVSIWFFQTLPIAIVVIDTLPDAAGEKSLMQMACIVAHLSQVKSALN